MVQIPRRAFFTWGGGPLCYLRYLTLYSFRKFHPDWEMIYYHHPHTVTQAWEIDHHDDSTIDAQDHFPADVQALDIEIRTTPRLPGAVPPPEELAASHCKDLLHWYLLATEGGIVFDMDLLFLRSMPVDDLLLYHHVLLSEPAPGYYPIAMMGSSGDSEFFDQCYRNAVTRFTPTRYQFAGRHVLDPFLNRMALTQRFPKTVFGFIPLAAVYPFTHLSPWDSGCQVLFNEDAREKIDAAAWAVHWYGATPRAHALKQMLTPTTLAELPPSTMIRLIREIVE